MIKRWPKYMFVLLCFFGLVLGCQKRLWPSEQGFPDREIVFSLPRPNQDTLGFIHPGGTGLMSRIIVDYNAAAVPTWSPNGEFIAFRTEDSYFQPSRLRIISSAGKAWNQCKAWGWAGGRVWVIEEKQVLFQLSLAEERDRIVLANWQSCKVLSTLFEASNDTSLELLDSAHLSSRGWLAVSRILKHTLPAEAQILVIAPDLDDAQIVGEGLAPAWSKDGEWLAFTAFDGIYIVRQDGSQKRKLVDIDSRSKRDPSIYGGLGWIDSPAAPSWSPDGEWIVYHRITSTGPAIYKIEVQSGTEVKIYEGGIYPNWRWDVD